MMSKDDLISKIAEKLDITKVQAREFYNTFVEVVKDEIVNGEADKVKLPDLVTFKKSHQKEREGRNPQTGESLTISARTRLSAAPVDALKEAVKDK